MTPVDLQMAKWVMLQLIISYGSSAESAWCFPGTSLSAYAGLFRKLLDALKTFFLPFFCKTSGCNLGCHVCLVKGSYDKWQQLYKLISL